MRCHATRWLKHSSHPRQTFRQGSSYRPMKTPRVSRSPFHPPPGFGSPPCSCCCRCVRWPHAIRRRSLTPPAPRSHSREFWQLQPASTSRGSRYPSSAASSSRRCRTARAAAESPHSFLHRSTGFPAADPARDAGTSEDQGSPVVRGGSSRTARTVGSSRQCRSLTRTRRPRV